MDAIHALVAGSQQIRATFDESAVALAGAALPRPSETGPTDPVVADPRASVDVAEQLTTMMVAAGMHAVTTAALRSALSMYQTSVEMLSR